MTSRIKRVTDNQNTLEGTEKVEQRSTRRARFENPAMLKIKLNKTDLVTNKKKVEIKARLDASKPSVFKMLNRRKLVSHWRQQTFFQRDIFSYCSPLLN